MSQTISSQEKTVATIEMQLDTLQTEKSLDTDRHQQQVPPYTITVVYIILAAGAPNSTD